MKEQFWDDVAPDYDEEIFNTLASDRNGLLEAVIRKHAKGARLACDFGCGVGRFVPLLLDCVPNVIATDFSAASLEIAADSLTDKQRKRVELQKRDLTVGRPRIGKADFGLLINVIIMPDRDHRRAILANVRRNMNPGGTLVVATPSLESVLYTHSRMIEWAERDGKTFGRAVAGEDKSASSEIVSLTSGIVKIRNLPTKHHLGEELTLELRRAGFELMERSRIEYAWSEDYESPPRWLQAPFPWDWLFVVRGTSEFWEGREERAGRAFV